jgi:hypothetical protein
MFMYYFIYLINYYTTLIVLLNPGKEHVFTYTGSKPNYCFFFYFWNFDMLLYLKKNENKNVNKLR